MAAPALEVREQSRQHPRVAEGAAQGPELALPTYLARNPDGYGGRVTSVPLRADVPIDLKESLVVEYYAR